MWVSREKMKALERKVAVLEEEQLTIKKYLEENITSNKELIRIVVKLRAELSGTKIIDTNTTE